MNGNRGLVIAIAAALIAGCAAGMVGGILLARFGMIPAMHYAGGPRGPHGGGPRGTGSMLERMGRDLDLTAEQRERIEDILEESRRGYAVVRESTHAAIARELTPAQRERWTQMEERFLRERRRGFGRPPWRGDRP